MYPLLYKPTSTVISPSNLEILGRMTKCSSCIVSEERNGDYLLNAVISTLDTCAKLLQTQFIIKAKPNPFDEPQYFLIYEITPKNLSEITIKAKHIKHCLYNNVITADGSGSSSEETPQEQWNLYVKEYIALENHFNFISDITTKKAMEMGYCIPCTVGMWLSNEEGCILNLYSGEYKYDNFNIYFLQKRGKDSKYKLRWGQNMSDCEQTISSENIASHIVATAEVFDEYKGKSYFVTGDVLPLTQTSSKLQSLYLLDVSNEASNNKEDWTINSHTGANIDLVKGQLNVRASANRQRIAESNGKPIANIKVNFRSDLDEMKNVALCDTVHVDVNGEDVTAKVIKTEFDCLLERWNKLEIGMPKSKLSDYIIK